MLKTDYLAITELKNEAKSQKKLTTVCEYMMSADEYFLQLNLNFMLNAIDEAILTTLFDEIDGFKLNQFYCLLSHDGEMMPDGDSPRALASFFNISENEASLAIEGSVNNLLSTLDLCTFKMYNSGIFDTKGVKYGTIHLTSLLKELEARGLQDCFEITYIAPRLYSLVFNSELILEKFKGMSLKRENF